MAAFHPNIDQLLNHLNHAIKEASHLMLKPKRNPYPKGVDWWNKECSYAHTLACTAMVGNTWMAAF